MPQFITQNNLGPLVSVLSALLLISLLYLGQTILIPLAFAILLSFLLMPVVNRLERWHLPRILSVLLATSVTFAILGSAGFVVTKQLIELAESLPQYRANIKERMRTLRDSGSSPLSKAAEVVKEVAEEVEQETQRVKPIGNAPDVRDQPATPPAGRQRPERSPPADKAKPGSLQERLLGPKSEPIPVEVRAPPPTTFQLLQDYLTPLLEPVAHAGIVIVFVIFILIQREDLRDRVIRLLGQGRLDLTTRALDEASGRISRYLLMQLLINAMYGIPVGIGLWLIGLPGALLWGILAMLLRFIPYIGAWLSAVLPILLALAVFDNWSQPLMVVGLFVVLEPVAAYVLEPWLYGSSTGLSPVAVLLATVFWSWLWGAMGLLLAVPLTVCLLVMGKYIPRLEFFTVLLSEEPALSPGARFYQRVLAMDDDEALDLAEAYRTKHGLVKLYDEVVVAALQLEESDRHAGHLDDERKDLVRQTMREIIEELGEWRLAQADVQNGEEPVVTAALVSDAQEKTAHRPVLCLPARDEADELAGRLFANLLRSEGFQAEALSAVKLASEIVEQVRTANASLVCISALPPGAVTHIRYLCKRLKHDLPEIRIMVGLWQAPNSERVTARLTATGAGVVVRTFTAGLEQVRRTVQPLAPVAEKTPEPAVTAEPAELST